MQYPSFYAHVLSGMFLFFAIGFSVMYSQQLLKQPLHIKLALLLIFSISTGVHGVSHMVLEKNYDYNPFYMVQM